MISALPYPNRRSAAPFHDVTFPSGPTPKMASPEPSTIAASWRRLASATPSSVTSMTSTPTPMTSSAIETGK